MPIETKPEEKTLHGTELVAALIDGIQRALKQRISNIKVLFANGSVAELEHLRLTVNVVGSLKGPKPGAKKRASKRTPAMPPAVPAAPPNATQTTEAFWDRDHSSTHRAD